MAFVSRISTLTFSGATGNRSWVATAAVQDTAAGSSVVITTAQTSGGATPPSVADVLTLRVKNEAGTIILAFVLTPGSASQTSTFFFTNDGTNTGTNRAGTLIIDIQATRTSLGTYDYETDGSPATAPTGFPATVVDRGWIRGSTTSTLVLSNASAGGAKNSPAEFDESLYTRVTLGADLYEAKAFTVALSNTTPSLTSTTNSAATGNFDITFTTVVDERYPAASNTTASTTTSPDSANTATAYVPLTKTEDSMLADPRLTKSHHFQVDNNTFSVALNDTTKQMLNSQTGFIATRFVGSRGTGINGLSVTSVLTPVAPGTAKTASSTTATRDTQLGWTDLLTWDSSKPGGTWNKTDDITAPADIDGATYIVGADDALVMLAPDPRISLFVGAGNLSVLTEHWNAGKSLTIGCALQNGAVKTAFLAGSAKCSLIRFNGATGTTEFLNASMEWVTGDTAYEHVMSASAGDAKLALITISAAVTEVTTPANKVWGAQDLFVSGVAKTADGTPYTGKATVGVLGTANQHSAYAFNPTSLFM